jgi:preprotein translocase subunit SecA
VAEGQLLEVHRNTWRYNQLIDVQRDVVLEHREMVLTGDQGDRQIRADRKKRHEELLEELAGKGSGAEEGAGAEENAGDAEGTGNGADAGAEESNEEKVARAARLITLYHLDRGWTDHNAFLSELREGIHLRFLGRRDPLDEFNRDAVPVFKGFLDDARARAAESFEELEVVDGELDVSSVGVKRPSMTWTYMVHDHPFSSAFETLVGRLKGGRGSGS